MNKETTINIICKRPFKKERIKKEFPIISTVGQTTRLLRRTLNKSLMN